MGRGMGFPPGLELFGHGTFLQSLSSLFHHSPGLPGMKGSGRCRCHAIPCRAMPCCVVPCRVVPCCAMPCFTWWCQQAMVFQGILLMLQILTGLNAVELICFPGYHSPQQGIINADQSHVILHTIRLQFNLCCPLPSHLIPPCCGPHSLGQD